MKNVFIQVKGHVFDTGYRFFVYNLAKAHKIKGYVRYTFSHNVEIIAEGLINDVNNFIEECQKPPSPINIKTFEIKEGEIRRYKSFSIKRRHTTKWWKKIVSMLKTRRMFW